jgi:hypothetical protein
MFSFFYLIRTQPDHCQPASNVWWDYWGKGRSGELATPYSF